MSLGPNLNPSSITCTSFSDPLQDGRPTRALGPRLRDETSADSGPRPRVPRDPSSSHYAITSLPSVYRSSSPCAVLLALFDGSVRGDFPVLLSHVPSALRGTIFAPAATGRLLAAGAFGPSCHALHPLSGLVCLPGHPNTFYFIYLQYFFFGLHY